MLAMPRLATDEIALHLEVALSGAALQYLTDLQHRDRYRRMAAVSSLAHHLAQRMACFEVRMEGGEPSRDDQPSLFAGASRTRGDLPAA